MRLILRLLVVAAGGFAGWLLSWVPLAAIWQFVPVGVGEEWAYPVAAFAAVVGVLVGAGVAWLVIGRRL